MGAYDDILHLPRPVSSRHAPMSAADRAAQFSPFAALTGYEDVIAETGRLTDSFVQLQEDRLQELNDKLLAIQADLENRPGVCITWFCPDGRKDGGAYEKITGCVKKIDETARRIFLTDGTAIPIDRIFHIELQK